MFKDFFDELCEDTEIEGRWMEKISLVRGDIEDLKKGAVSHILETNPNKDFYKATLLLQLNEFFKEEILNVREKIGMSKTWFNYNPLPNAALDANIESACNDILERYFITPYFSNPKDNLFLIIKYNIVVAPPLVPTLAYCSSQTQPKGLIRIEFNSPVGKEDFFKYTNKNWKGMKEMLLSFVDTDLSKIKEKDIAFLEAIPKYNGFGQMSQSFTFNGRTYKRSTLATHYKRLKDRYISKLFRKK